MIAFDLLSPLENEQNADENGYFVRQVNYEDTKDFILNAFCIIYLYIKSD